EDSEHIGSRTGEPDGSARERPPCSSGDRGLLTSRYMLTAISRYAAPRTPAAAPGGRPPPTPANMAGGEKARDEFIQGPHIRRFEESFARRLGGGEAIAASYGRMAFYYILKALDLPPGSE